MKKIIIVFVLFVSAMGLNFAGDNEQDTAGINFYTIFVNIVNEQFQFPLIGLVNIAGGSHKLPQIGLANWNHNNFGTSQVGLVNTVGGGMAGLQAGLINTVIDDTDGAQVGLVNTTAQSVRGAQIGLVNTTRSLTGLQLGLINYTDEIGKGIPVGLVSVARNGGYKAVELGVSEAAPFAMSFKIGVERLYTAIIFSYNPFQEGVREHIIWGAGFGTIFQLGDTLYVNPEITAQNAIGKNFRSYTRYVSIVPNLGVNLMPAMSIVAGPSVTWAYDSESTEKQFYSIIEHSINDTNKLYLGARLGIRFRW